jgi:cardiolipin synthase (CMP-forming)
MASAASGRPARGILGRVTFALKALAPFYAANSLTIARLICILPIVWAALSGRLELAFWIFLFAALSDAADGFVAKWFHGATPFGALLDPVADKLLIGAVALALSVLGLVPAWFAAAVIARDLLLAAGSWLLRRRRQDFRVEPLIIGKLCTLAQLLYLGWVLGEEAGLGPAVKVTDVLLPVAAVMTAASAAAYLATAVAVGRRASDA